MTISTKVKNNLIDTGIVVVVTLISLILWPLVTDWLLKLGGKLFNSDVMAEFLPTILIGLFQGTVTAWLIRNRRLYIAMLPAISLSGFMAISLFLTHIKFHSNIYSKDAIFIMNLLLWVISAFLSARWVLKRRNNEMEMYKNKKSVEGQSVF